MTPPSPGSAVGHGVVGTALSALVLLVTGVPAATALLAALAVAPSLALLLAVAQPGRRPAWLRAAVAMLLGAGLCLALVVGLISGFAHLLSDPA